MRKFSRTAAVGAAALFVVAIPGTAQADPGRARPPQPVSPPGVEETRQADEACSPLTGRLNRFVHGSCDQAP